MTLLIMSFLSSCHNSEILTMATSFCSQNSEPGGHCGLYFIAKT